MGLNEMISIINDKLLCVKYLGTIKNADYIKFYFTIENKSDGKITINVNNIFFNKVYIDTGYDLNLIFQLFPEDISESCFSIELNQELLTILKNKKDVNVCSNFIILSRKNKLIKTYENISIKVFDIVENIKLQMKSVLKEIDNGNEWLTHKCNFPKTITYDFVYPDGKNGDINFELLSKVGNCFSKGNCIYSVQIKTQFTEVIESTLLYNYLLFSNNYYAAKCPNTNAIEFMNCYNNIMILNQLYNLCYKYIDQNDHLSDAVIQQAYHTIKNKYNSIQYQRVYIYSDLIANGKVSCKWKSEAQLFSISKEFFKDAIFQYCSDWLGMQSLDIYIPSVKVAIEYQGKQHYEPVKFFGGESVFESQKERDNKKRTLCQKNDITLIEWPYTRSVTKENFFDVFKYYIKQK